MYHYNTCHLFVFYFLNVAARNILIISVPYIIFLWECWSRQQVDKLKMSFIDDDDGDDDDDDDKSYGENWSGEGDEQADYL